MSNWKNINGIDLETLKSNRKSLHQAVQIVSTLPRNVLPHDPTDATASLVWNTKTNGLESIPVPNPKGIDIRAGLAFHSFSLYISENGDIISSFALEGKSIIEGFGWLKKELAKADIPTEKLNLDLPYEIEKYDYSKVLSVDYSSLKEYAFLYDNTLHVLTSLVEKYENAFDIRCWPHHFDLATLIPVELDEKDEIVKSIGIGLSPGDEGVEEPYVYVNVWPNVDFAVLSQNQLPAGHWNAEGWSGAVLTYTELLKATDQQESFSGFIDQSLSVISSNIK
ncbi:MAG: hypothetical protein JXR03_13670 [Cyclobacteriaceae bacterium]